MTARKRQHWKQKGVVGMSAFYVFVRATLIFSNGIPLTHRVLETRACLRRLANLWSVHPLPKSSTQP